MSVDLNKILDSNSYFFKSVQHKIHKREKTNRL